MELKDQIRLMDAEDAIRHLTEEIEKNPDNEDAFLLRGRKYWSLNRRSEAINDYLSARRINPEGKANDLLKATYEILDYYNKDLYNP